MNQWLLDHLACPRDKETLERKGDSVICKEGHSYPVVDDIPVMLVAEAEITHGYITGTLEKVAAIKNGAPDMAPATLNGNGIDEYVQHEIPYTSGILYLSVQHKLTRYPIPDSRLRPGSGERLLDVGCNWGRWSIAAAKKGYKTVGIDPSLDAVMAARRVSKQLDTDVNFVVGDARFLPFKNDSFDTVFSYSVFQHFSKENARISFDEIARVCKVGGNTLIQMANKYGIRQYQQRRRRGFTEGEGFDVRYWTPSELIATFEEKFGPTKLTADCYFGLGIQSSDADLLPIHYKAVVGSSELLRKLSGVFRPLIKAADSVYLESVNQKVEQRPI